MEKSNKKNPAKKKNSSKKKRKPKVYIPLNSIISLCAIIVGICTAFLLIYSFSTSLKSSPKKKSPVEKVVEKEIIPEPLKAPEKEKGVSKKTPDTNKTEAPVTKPVPEKKAVQSEKTPSPVKKEVEEKKELPPVVSEEKKVPKKTSDIPAIPLAVNSAKLVILFDDAGQNLSQLEKCISLPFPVTVAVLPRLTHSREAAVKVRASGNEVILHQPMQSVNPNVNPGSGAIKPGMTEDEIRTILFQNINEIAPITGMNNHEGSLITADAEKMSWIMNYASTEGIYFLDSRTNVETKVPYVGRALGYSYYERNIFLDNKKTRENIIAEFMKGLSIANKNGAAIMIGHVWSAEILPGILAELYPLAIEKGYKFTTVSNSGALITP